LRPDLGDKIGLALEEAFYTKAKAAGMTDEEAKSAFNTNMMATGLLSEFPCEFARDNGRRWLVSAYEAGDVVLHKPHMVGSYFFHLTKVLQLTTGVQIHASTINNDPDNVIRLATDLRFCDSSKPYDKASLIKLPL
jgi:phytanoyl-CoA hydroxylase